MTTGSETTALALSPGVQTTNPSGSRMWSSPVLILRSLRKTGRVRRAGDRRSQWRDWLGWSRGRACRRSSQRDERRRIRGAGPAGPPRRGIRPASWVCRGRHSSKPHISSTRWRRTLQRFFFAPRVPAAKSLARRKRASRESCLAGGLKRALEGSLGEIGRRGEGQKGSQIFRTGIFRVSLCKS
jgi:hypothetical protein